MDPLQRFEHPEISDRIPKKMMKLLKGRMKYVEKGVRRIELASNLKYPPYYVEPILPLAATSLEIGKYGALFSRTIPTLSPQGVRIVVQVSAPLVAFGLLGTIEAVLAHEFLHYVEFVRRFTKMDNVAEEISTSLYESSYADAELLYNPKTIFKDKSLVRLVERKFRDGLVDEKLYKKTEEEWIAKGLPMVRVTPESNTLRLPLSAIINSLFDPMLKIRLEELDRVTLERAQRI